MLLIQGFTELLEMRELLRAVVVLKAEMVQHLWVGVVLQGS